MTVGIDRRTQAPHRGTVKTGLMALYLALVAGTSIAAPPAAEEPDPAAAATPAETALAEPAPLRDYLDQVRAQRRALIERLRAESREDTERARQQHRESLDEQTRARREELERRRPPQFPAGPAAPAAPPGDWSNPWYYRGW
jgi:hypothetical protein